MSSSYSITPPLSISLVNPYVLLNYRRGQIVPDSRTWCIPHAESFRFSIPSYSISSVMPNFSYRSSGKLHQKSQFYKDPHLNRISYGSFVYPHVYASVPLPTPLHQSFAYPSRNAYACSTLLLPPSDVTQSRNLIQTNIAATPVQLVSKLPHRNNFPAVATARSVFHSSQSIGIHDLSVPIVRATTLFIVSHAPSEILTSPITLNKNSLSLNSSIFSGYCPAIRAQPVATCEFTVAEKEQSYQQPKCNLKRVTNLINQENVNSNFIQCQNARILQTRCEKDVKIGCISTADAVTSGAYNCDAIANNGCSAANAPIFDIKGEVHTASTAEFSSNTGGCITNVSCKLNKSIPITAASCQNDISFISNSSADIINFTANTATFLKSTAIKKTYFADAVIHTTNCVEKSDSYLIHGTNLATASVSAVVHDKSIAEHSVNELAIPTAPSLPKEFPASFATTNLTPTTANAIIIFSASSVSTNPVFMASTTALTSCTAAHIYTNSVTVETNSTPVRSAQAFIEITSGSAARIYVPTTATCGSSVTATIMPFSSTPVPIAASLSNVANTRNPAGEATDQICCSNIPTSKLNAFTGIRCNAILSEDVASHTLSVPAMVTFVSSTTGYMSNTIPSFTSFPTYVTSAVTSMTDAVPETSNFLASSVNIAQICVSGASTTSDYAIYAAGASKFKENTVKLHIDDAYFGVGDLDINNNVTSAANVGTAVEFAQSFGTGLGTSVQNFKRMSLNTESATAAITSAAALVMFSDSCNLSTVHSTRLPAISTVSLASKAAIPHTAPRISISETISLLPKTEGFFPKSSSPIAHTILNATNDFCTASTCIASGAGSFDDTLITNRAYADGLIMLDNVINKELNTKFGSVYWSSQNIKSLDTSTAASQKSQETSPLPTKLSKPTNLPILQSKKEVLLRIKGTPIQTIADSVVKHHTTKAIPVIKMQHLSTKFSTSISSFNAVSPSRIGTSECDYNSDKENFMPNYTKKNVKEISKVMHSTRSLARKNNRTSCIAKKGVVYGQTPSNSLVQHKTFSMDHSITVRRRESVNNLTVVTSRAKIPLFNSEMLAELSSSSFFSKHSARALNDSQKQADNGDSNAAISASMSQLSVCDTTARKSKINTSVAKLQALERIRERKKFDLINQAKVDEKKQIIKGRLENLENKRKKQREHWNNGQPHLTYTASASFHTAERRKNVGERKTLSSSVNVCSLEY